MIAPTGSFTLLVRITPRRFLPQDSPISVLGIIVAVAHDFRERVHHDPALCAAARACHGRPSHKDGLGTELGQEQEVDITVKVHSR